MTTPDGPRHARGWLLVILVVALTIVLLGGYGVIRARNFGDTDVNTSLAPQLGLACVQDVGMDDGYCERFAADLSRRAPLTADQVGPAQSARQSVTLALSGDVLNRCNVKHEPCDSVMAWGDRPATAEEVRSRLVTLTPNAPEVRLARPDDPAVADSVAFAVLIGSVCVYGHQRFNKDADRVYAAGLLPNGTCLAP